MSEITKIPGLKAVITEVASTMSNALHGLLILPPERSVFVPETTLEKRCGKIGRELEIDATQIQCRAKVFLEARIEMSPAGSFERQWNQMIVSALSLFEDTLSDEASKLPLVDFPSGPIPIPPADSNNSGKYYFVPYFPTKGSEDHKKDVIQI